MASDEAVPHRSRGWAVSRSDPHFPLSPSSWPRCSSERWGQGWRLRHRGATPQASLRPPWRRGSSSAEGVSDCIISLGTSGEARCIRPDQVSAAVVGAHRCPLLTRACCWVVAGLSDPQVLAQDPSERVLSSR